MNRPISLRETSMLEGGLYYLIRARSAEDGRGSVVWKHGAYDLVDEKRRFWEFWKPRVYKVPRDVPWETQRAIRLKAAEEAKRMLQDARWQDVEIERYRCEAWSLPRTIWRNGRWTEDA